MNSSIRNKILSTTLTTCGRFVALAAALSVISLEASAQSIPPASVVFKNANVVMGYTIPGQAADVAGYPNCFTSIGSHFTFRSDNSANIEPYFELFRSGNSIQINKHPAANGNGAYVCLNSDFVGADIRTGIVGAGTTNIGAGLSCVTSIANFGKSRVGSGETPASLTCTYDSTTGNITTTVTNGGVLSACGYTCAVPNSNRVTNLVSRNYYKIYGGTENIGTNLQCAYGNVVMSAVCTGVGFHHGSYTASTGAVVMGQTDGCTTSSKSYLCINPAKRACADLVDNDGDGLTDAADPGCWADPKNPATYSAARENEGAATSQCQDGIDNDADGAIDSADFSCSSPQDNDESNPKSGCQDGLDNDSDGLVDLADPGCANGQDNNEGDKTSQCQDGIDNDNDGAIDLADQSCSSRTDNDETNPKSACQDGIDNDGDGAIDMTDFSCSSNQDNDEANPKSGCQDGLDNDNDGLTDLADPGCSSNQDNNEGDGTSACQDRIDNDNDGLIDLADPGCSSPQDLNEGDGTSACQDKVDNDGDGLVDLADPGCANPQDGNEVDEVSKLQVTTECVYDNKDGTFTAYFGYENLLGAETTVVSDSAKNTVNAFTPALPSGGQVSTFKTGRQKGAFGVVFNGDPLVWTVQISQGVKSSATASRASTACKSVEPVAECIDSNSTSLLGTFGYINSNDFPVRIAVGTFNKFNPAPENRNQLTTFLAGTNKAAIVTEFKDELSWTLGGKTASVTPSTAVCEGGCVGTATTETKSSLDNTALELAGYATKAANNLAAQAKKNLSASAAAKIVRDATRAKKRAADLVKVVNNLGLEFPAIVRTCPNAAKVCSTIDRDVIIKGLQNAYKVLENMTRRFYARAAFVTQGSTASTKSNATIRAAKDAAQRGLAAAALLPRFATECK